MDKHGHAVTEEEHDLITSESARLRKILDTADHNEIREQMAKVDSASRALAEKIMDSSLNTALKSQKVDDVMSAGGRGGLSKES